MTRFVVAGLLLAPAALAGEGYPPPKTLGSVASYGANVQRAMTLLATSTPEKRNTVRVLFYGQSITDQPWTAAVARDLRARYPFADLHVENRAIGGYGSNVLVRTAEADLYPAYPDLLIFHVYGPPAEYEAIVRRVRERTIADILHATDHIAPHLGEKLDEPTDPARLTPADGHLWKNHVFLPGVSARYATELADVRGLWRQYLRDHRLSPSDLLADELHPNGHGNYVMAEVVKAHLRHRPELPTAGWKDRVVTHAVGAGAKWDNGTLTLPFEGNRVDLVFRPGAAGSPVGVRIDDKRPSEFPDLYLATRTYNVEPPEPKPILMRVGATAPRVVEEWTLTATDFADEGRRFKYTVSGSVTGADGAGDSAVPFVSKSGRVAIEPADFHLQTLARLAQQYKQSRLVVRWNVLPLFADSASPPPARGPGLEAAVTVAQGLPPGRHVLQLTGGPDSPLEAVRVFRPPLAPAQ